MELITQETQITGNECRICAKKSTQVWQVFQTYEEIPRKIMACAAVQVEEGDGLPSVICHNCHELLNVSYEFKCQAEQSDAEFRNILEYKASIDNNQIQTSLSDSVNAAITEAMTVNHNLDSVNNDESSLTLTNLDNQKHQKNDESSYSKSYVFTRLLTKSNVDNKTSIITPMAINQNIINNQPVLETIYEEKHVKVVDKKNFLNDEENKFKCLHCLQSFEEKSKLSEHMSVHKNLTTTSIFNCYMCDQKFSTLELLKSHVHEAHDSLKSNENLSNDSHEFEDLILDDDDETVDNKTTNNTEIKTDIEFIKTETINNGEQKVLKYPCKYCSKRFKYEKSYQTHINKHPEHAKSIENNPTKKEKIKKDNDFDDDGMPLEHLQCTQCGKIFATQRNLKRHILTHSGQKFTCTTCNKAFSRLDKLKEHEHSKHNDKIFDDSSEDNDDDEDDDDDNENGKKINGTTEKKKKEKQKRPHSCPMCPRAFALAQSLTNHMERHKRVKVTQKRYLCEVCSKCFAQGGSLIAHMRTHTGVKPYVCNICSRGFTKSTYLQLHLRTHSGEKPYICQYCSRAFARANTLARHLTMHTGEAKYHCQICKKSFRRLTSLNEHTYTHTGQRPYACKTCPKRYNNAGSLYAHAKKCKTMQMELASDNTYSQEASNPQESSNSSSSTLIYESKKFQHEEMGVSEAPYILGDPNVQSEQKTIEIEVNGTLVKAAYYTIHPIS